MRCAALGEGPAAEGHEGGRLLQAISKVKGLKVLGWTCEGQVGEAPNCRLAALLRRVPSTFGFSKSSWECELRFVGISMYYRIGTP